MHDGEGNGLATTYLAAHSGRAELSLPSVPNGHVVRPKQTLDASAVINTEARNAFHETDATAEKVVASLAGSVVTPSQYVYSAAGKAAIARSGIRPPSGSDGDAGLDRLIHQLTEDDENGVVGYFSRTAPIEDGRLGGSLSAYAAAANAWEASVTEATAGKALGFGRSAKEVEAQISELKRLSTRPILKAGRPTMLSTYDVTFNKDDAISDAIDAALTARLAARARNAASFVAPPAAASAPAGTGGSHAPAASTKPQLNDLVRDSMVRGALAEEYGERVADAALPLPRA
ncbi:uncharacterized protein AMSG_03921 [Thecamonas trahens ATCC 50062]|uniref:Uncharacterized protein n=1 Tax=Thecamonas trahens ATCC 50062 TaxID=461836 RepID=A0A0L0D5R4_THETB|nr:hypothetical protein AMSG_03921 [Thecamonas trahens ATCC 50062]KNC47689.1 hypothetical protein AMSG_03921 [Thecamonas trahens ATCC 50062]|eukprot:XP_013759171.1 hypothetical protein AMSG_03921 [Thecamonas trahens ATCC 50062]